MLFSSTRLSGGGTGGGTIGGTIAASQIAAGTGTDTIGGNSTFTYDPIIGQLSVGSPVNSNYLFPEFIATFYGDFGGLGNPDFASINVQNISQYGSTDVIVANNLDDGTVATGVYGDFGIAGSDYQSSGDTFTVSNDVYLYASPNAGNLNISTLGAGRRIRFATEGDSLDQIRADIAEDRMTIYANKDPELVPNFTPGNWDATGGWTANTTTLDLVSDSGPNVINPSTPLTIVPGTTYKVVITSSGVTGSVTYTLGGETGSTIVDGTVTDFIVASTSGDLVITGAASATAVISKLSVRALIPNTGDLFIEGNLKFGSFIQNTSGAPILFSDAFGQATFSHFPIGPSGFPTTGLELANKNYVDANIAGNIPLPSSQLATTGNITLSGEQTIDGTLTSSSTVLVWKQTSQKDNGIYVSGAGAWTRASYYDTTAEVRIGTFTFVTGGSTNIGKTFSQYLFNPATDTLGVDPIAFTVTNTAPTYTASNGVKLVANDFSAKLSTNGAITLTGIGMDELTVNADNSTLEVATNILRVKDSGITNAKISAVAWSKVTGTPTTLAGYGITNSQIGIQFDNESGVALGTTGTVNEFEITGSGVTSVRAGNKVTTTIAGAGGISIDALTAATLVTITDAANFVFNGSSGTIQTITLGANRTFTISNLKVGIPYTFLVKQDSTGSRTLTWGTTVKVAYAGGGTPAISTSANAVDKYSLVSDGTNIYVDMALNYT